MGHQTISGETGRLVAVGLAGATGLSFLVVASAVRHHSTWGAPLLWPCSAVVQIYTFSRNSNRAGQMEAVA